MPVRPALPADRPVLERLWPLFQHDLSEWRGLLPFADGTYRSERLHASFTDPDWAAYLMTGDDRPAGFALVRGLTSGTRVLSAFFVVRGARRTGLGLTAAREVLTRHPGAWQIPYQDANLPASRFWPRVAGSLAEGSWTTERRDSDTWISLIVAH